MFLTVLKKVSWFILTYVNTEQIDWQQMEESWENLDNGKHHK